MLLCAASASPCCCSTGPGSFWRRKPRHRDRAGRHRDPRPRNGCGGWPVGGVDFQSRGRDRLPPDPRQDSRPGRVDSDSRRAAYDDLDRELQRKQDRWEDSRESTVVRPRPLGPDARPPEPPRPLRPSESGSARIVARSASAAESGSARIVARSPEPPYSRGAAESGSARIVARSPEPPYSRGAAESGSGRVSEWLDHDTHDSSIDEGDYDAHHGIPEPVQREPSSPWLDSDAKGSADKRGSLRRAGRPTRKPDAGGPQPEPGTGTYRTGKQPKRDSRALGEPRDEGTRTGLRTGRRPKREG